MEYLRIYKVFLKLLKMLKKIRRTDKEVRKNAKDDSIKWHNPEDTNLINCIRNIFRKKRQFYKKYIIRRCSNSF